SPFKVEKLAAVPRPDREVAAVLRDGPAASRARERLHVDLPAARFVGLVRQPAAVRGERGGADVVDPARQWPWLAAAIQLAGGNVRPLPEDKGPPLARPGVRQLHCRTDVEPIPETA